MNEASTKVQMLEGKLVFGCPICGKWFRSSGAAGVHLMWCKCKHCAHWVPGTISYRRCLAGKGAYVHDEGSSPPPNNCSDYRRK
jgi:hypothetical protein